MPGRTPGVHITNVEETRDPLVSDDLAQALDVGSRWINTTTGSIWYCIDNSLGAAIWRPSVPQGGMETRNNFSAVVDPSISDDSTKGYSIGSLWINTAASPRRVFVSVQSTAGSAVWIQTTNTIDNTDSPGQYLLGSILDYSLSANLPQNEIQYTRVFLLAGLTITKVEVFVDSGGSPSRDLRVGLYNQATPSSVSGVPNARVAQSASTATGGANGNYFPISFTSPYVIPVSGFYWIALVGDSNSIKLVVTSVVYRENYPPTRRESTSGNILPATAGSLTNPASAIAFAAAEE